MDDAMGGKVCLITGATSGLGRVTARELATMGATVIGVGRDPTRCEKTCADIQDVSGNLDVEFLIADLSDLTMVRCIAEEFREKYSRLDVLINNAGAFFLRRTLNSAGMEMTWALNQLSYFLLTNLLLDQIIASAPARIVNVASGAHYVGKIRFDDLNLERGYNGWKAYSQSKLANVLFTYELARRLRGTGVTVNSLSPGFVATGIGHNTPLLVRYVWQTIQNMRGKSPEEGAETIVYLANSKEVEGVSGKFYVDKEAVKSSPISYDNQTSLRLWEICEQMTGLRVDLS
jgi:NAD(P)-dependent dehydrogenase (short-subunit alcohol dehydrogenase family)